MIKKWIPGILCGGLLAGSLLAFAASEDQAPPSLSTVYNLAVANELSPREVTLAYVHALVAQRKLELTKAHIDFVKQEAKAASSGLFHHPDQETQESVQGSVDLTQADYFAAQAEYQANLQYLNQLLGKAYDQVQSLKNDEALASLDPQLKARYSHLADQTQQLRIAEQAYRAGQATAEQLIQTEQGLYTAQEEYWDQIQAYLSSEIKTEGAPSVIADLQEKPASLPQNHWARADAAPARTAASGKVAELLSDSQQAFAPDMLKATKSERPSLPAASAKQIKQVELAAQAVRVAAPLPPATRTPSLPALPQPEPSVNSAALKRAPATPAALSKPIVPVAPRKPAELAVKTLPAEPKLVSLKQPAKQVELAAQAVRVAAPLPPVTRTPSLPALPQPEASVNSAALKAVPARPAAVSKAIVSAAPQKPAQVAMKTLPAKPKLASVKPAAKPLAVSKHLEPLNKAIVAEVVEPKKLAIKSTTKRTAMSKADLSSLFASVDVSEWTGPEEFHAYILPMPTSTVQTQLSELLPAPQSTKFEYV